MTKSRSIEQLEAGLGKHFGEQVTRASLTKSLKVIPTGILALDYALGTGGWPIGYCHGIYGPRDIGKSSILGLSAIREAQKLGKIPVVILVEPTGGENWTSWIVKNGVDPDGLLCLYPENGEEAFAMAHRVARSGNADLLIFDSIGALLSESEFAEDGKMKMGGQAGLITWGMKALGPLVYKYDVCALMLNHVRADMHSRVPGMVQQPGGFAIENIEQIIVRLRSGKDKFTIKDGGDDVTVGRQIIGVIERNKANEGDHQKAIFNYFSAETDKYPFGVDVVTDVINTGKRTGVITQAGSYFTLPNGKQIQGAIAVGEYLDENVGVYQIIREEILKVMLTKTGTRNVLSSSAEDVDEQGTETKA